MRMSRSAWVIVCVMVLSACAAPGADGRVAGAVATTASPTPTPTRSPSPRPSPTPTGTPVPPADLGFAVVGDFGTGAADEIAVATRMCRWRERHPFRLVITTGDNIYPDGAPGRFEAAFFDPFACLLEEGVRFRAVLGNHDILTDGGAPELETPEFGMKGRNYVVRTGGVRFVLVDSNALDRAWLGRATRPEPGDRWTVVSFHHPVYSPGTGHGSTPGFRPDLPRLFRRRGVDLVLSGHDHIYAVTKPLRRIRYVVTGGGGAPLYGCSEQWFSERCEERHHFLWVRARTRGIRVRAVPPTGPPFHDFRTTGRE